MNALRGLATELASRDVEDWSRHEAVEEAVATKAQREHVPPGQSEHQHQEWQGHYRPRRSLQCADQGEQQREAPEHQGQIVGASTQQARQARGENRSPMLIPPANTAAWLSRNATDQKVSETPMATLSATTPCNSRSS